MNEAEIAAGLAETPGYRYAEVVDGHLHLAGQVPHDAAGGLVAPDDHRGQAVACLDNLRTLLDVHGFEATDIRHLTIHVVGERPDLGAAWTGVLDWWDGEVPPATLLGVPVLGHPGQLVEIDSRIQRAGSA